MGDVHISIDEIISTCPPNIDIVAWVRDNWRHPYMSQEVKKGRQSKLDDF